MSKDVVSGFGCCATGSFSNVPAWARDMILAGAYQQGRADTLQYVFNEMMKKQAVR